jgi:hypothetical protein
MTTNLLAMLLVSSVGWVPTIDGERVEFGYYKPPYDLGITFAPHEEGGWITAKQMDEVLFTVNDGTHWKLAYIESYEPIYFYEDGVFVGVIVPEPSTMSLFVLGLLYLRNRKYHGTE